MILIKLAIHLACKLLILSCLLTGCCSELITIAHAPPEKFEKLGPTSGSSTGSLGILGTAYYFIPMSLNERIDDAYQKAVESVPGATGLIDVSVQENWFWWVVGTARTVTIQGEAIRDIQK